MRVLSEMCIMAEKDSVLKTLIANRTEHSEIVKEARKGFIEKARTALKKRLEELESGKLVEMTFNLYPPQDQTKVYDTAIKMLEMHTDKTIALSSDQVRCLIMDEWDWTNAFLTTASAYSNSARNKLNNR